MNRTTRYLLAVLVSAFGFVGCSAKTQVAADIGILSFIPPDAHTQKLEMPAVDGEYFLLLLPYYDQLVSAMNTVEAEFTRGFKLEYPVPKTRVKGDIVLSFTVDATFWNTGESGQFDEVTLALFAAPLSTDNVYTEGQRVLSFSIEDLEPGTDATLQGTKTIRPGDPGFELLTTGALRLGARSYFRAQGPAQIQFQMYELRARISIRPFSLLP